LICCDFTLIFKGEMMRKSTTRTTGFMFAAALAAMLAVPAPASAAMSEPRLEMRVSTHEPDVLCEQARVLSRSAGPCAAESTLVASAASPVDVKSTDPRDLTLRSTDGVALRDAVVRGGVSTRTWSQNKRGAFHVNWSETHSGRVYWDGTRVWSTTSTNGYKGSHTCGQSSGIGFSIKVTKCATEKIGAATLREWDYFQAHVLVTGVPIYASHNMRVPATKTGAMS
jgi:hypothetical protein